MPILILYIYICCHQFSCSFSTRYQGNCSSSKSWYHVWRISHTNHNQLCGMEVCQNMHGALPQVDWAGIGHSHRPQSQQWADYKNSNIKNGRTCSFLTVSLSWILKRRLMCVQIWLRLSEKMTFFWDLNELPVSSSWRSISHYAVSLKAMLQGKCGWHKQVTFMSKSDLQKDVGHVMYHLYVAIWR